jgi:hypothetical protein
LKTNGVIAGKYYICCQTGCPAKYQINKMYDGKLVTKYSNAHNHHPPSKPRVLNEVKEQSILQLSVGALPSNMHKQLVNNMPSMSPAYVPNVSVEQMKACFISQGFAHGYAFYLLTFSAILSLLFTIFLLLYCDHSYLGCLQVMYLSILQPSTKRPFCSCVTLHLCGLFLQAILDWICFLTASTSLWMGLMELVNRR